MARASRRPRLELRRWRPSPAELRLAKLNLAVERSIDAMSEQSDGDIKDFAEEYLKKLLGRLVRTLRLNKDIIFQRVTEEEYRLRAEESD